MPEGGGAPCWQSFCISQEGSRWGAGGWGASLWAFPTQAALHPVLGGQGEESTRLAQVAATFPVPILPSSSGTSLTFYVARVSGENVLLNDRISANQRGLGQRQKDIWMPWPFHSALLQPHCSLKSIPGAVFLACSQFPQRLGVHTSPLDTFRTRRSGGPGPAAFPRQGRSSCPLCETWCSAECAAQPQGGSWPRSERDPAGVLGLGAPR